MRIILICLCSIGLCTGSATAADTITFYRDGTRIQQDATATKGLIEIPRAPDMLEHSLTIIPTTGTVIQSVETRAVINGQRVDKELDTLTEQRQRLEDRLQALETRETIFTSAAKTQSGKAPRKSKTNPDPMQTIRQGTDFAIAQLEAVYTARRRTQQEIRKIDASLVAARKKSRPAENILRISVSPPRGTVTLRYATTVRGWQPHYNLHLAESGSARLELSAQLTGASHGFQARISSGSLAESATAETVAVQAGGTRLASFQLALTEAQYPDGLVNRFSGKITNSSRMYLPAGESTLFRNGSYRGNLRFEGLSSGRSRVITMGRGER